MTAPPPGFAARRIEPVDALVIGSGPNGLAAAIRLAESGRSVVVCEAADTPGGAVRSAELTLPGVTHDVFSAVHPAAVVSPVFARLPLSDHGLEWVVPGAAMAHPLPDGRAGVLYRDLDRTADVLDDLHPGDGSSWRDWARPLVDHLDEFRDTALGAFPPIGPGLRLTAALGVPKALEMLGVLIGSGAGLGERLFDGEHARAWLYGTCMHLDVPLHERGSAIGGAWLQVLGHGTGWPSPRGGAGALTSALVDHLASLGGEVRVRQPVERLVVADATVQGAVTAGGERYRAPLVVATTTPAALVTMAGSALPSSYADRLTDFTMGPRTVKVDWALDGPAPWTAEAVREAGTVHVGGGPDEVRAATDAVADGRIPVRPFLLYGQQTVADPSRAPDGVHTAWAYTHLPAGAGGAEVVLAHVERMTDQVERFAPGFRERVLARCVHGPADLEAANPNLLGGDVGGGSYELAQTVFRPVVSPVPYATPVRGLWLGSSSTWPGGGVHGACGHAAAGYALAADRVGRHSARRFTTR